MNNKKPQPKKQHDGYMFHILKENFQRRFSAFWGKPYYVCKSCNTTLYSEKEATDHYFKLHKQNEKPRQNNSTSAATK